MVTASFHGYSQLYCFLDCSFCLCCHSLSPQIRQFDGQPLTHSFNASDTLVDVNRFIMMNRDEDESTPFSLMTSFPRHVFTPDEMNKTLKELGETNRTGPPCL